MAGTSVVGVATLRTAALDRVAAQWIALGAQLAGLEERTPIDLEALVAITAQHATAEARTYGVAVDWCVAFGSVIHVARLKTVADEIGVSEASLARFGGDVVASGGPRWPMAAAGTGYASRRKAHASDLTAPSRLSWRVRSAFGVQARSDILAVLMMVPPTAMTIADLARRTRYSKKNVALSVNAMSLAGIVSRTRVGNEDRVSLDRASPLRQLLEPQGVPDVDWASRWTVISRLLQATEALAEAPAPARVVEARTLTVTLLPLLGPAGLSRPDLTVVGSRFEDEFEAWIDQLASGLMLMSA